MDSYQTQNSLLNTKRQNTKDSAFNMNEDLKKYIPENLPFPASRLNRSELTFGLNRGQIVDIHGSYVLTHVDQLPAGGLSQQLKIPAATMEMFLLGDMGRANEIRTDVLQKILKQCKKNTSANTGNVLYGLGDWMYPYGPTDASPEELHRAQQTIFNDIAPLARQYPFYGILGNHEYGDSTQGAAPEIFMSYAQRHAVQIPQRYYALEIQAPDWVIDCFALDTSVLACDPDQVQWLQQQVQISLNKQAAQKQRRWRFIMGHHPLISYGFHFEENEFLIDLFRQALKNIDLYCAGHEHDMQFIKPSDADLPAIIISGTISESRLTWTGPDSILSSSEHGYAKIHVSQQKLAVEFNETYLNKKTLTTEIEI